MAQANDRGENQEPLSFRTWTDITGKHKTNAAFVGFEDGKVLLQKKNGSIVAVPIGKLCEADQEYVRQHATHSQTDDQRSGADTRSTPDKPDDRAKQTSPQRGADKPNDRPKQTATKRDTDKPDDRPKQTASQDNAEEAKIFIIVNGQKFPRPGLETFFAQSGVGRDPQCACNPVVGVFCSCNKVCTCVPVCGCVGHRSCSCDSHTSGGGGVITGCRCAPVH
jgi:hypothetical protein